MSARISSIVSDRGARAPGAALHVEVVADLVCPFCYLGKRRLDTALAAVQGPRDVSWYPFQLNPEMPAEGLAFEAYLTTRFGSPANVQPVLETLAAEGRAEGIELRFDRIKRVPTTMPAHQVMYLAETAGVDQSALAETLMAAFFTDGKDTGDFDTLVELAGRHDIGPDEVARAVNDESIRQAVQTREAQVRASGISGVPGFLLNRRLLVVGAQEPDAMINAFDRAMFGEGTDELVSPGLH